MTGIETIKRPAKANDGVPHGQDSGYLFWKVGHRVGHDKGGAGDTVTAKKAQGGAREMDGDDSGLSYG